VNHDSDGFRSGRGASRDADHPDKDPGGAKDAEISVAYDLLVVRDLSVHLTPSPHLASP